MALACWLAMSFASCLLHLIDRSGMNAENSRSFLFFSAFLDCRYWLFFGWSIVGMCLMRLIVYRASALVGSLSNRGQFFRRVSDI